MEIEITDNLITRGLRKFSLRIFKNTYIIKESYNMMFCYDPQKDDYVNKFYMSELHFSIEIYKGEISIYYKPIKKLCSITQDEKGELHFVCNKEINSSLYYSLLFKFLYSCSELIADDVSIDNDGICKWANNTMK